MNIQTHKCIILSSELRQSCRPMEYGIYMLIHILVDTGAIVTKIIHEPMYYMTRYPLQIFSRHEKKVVPMSKHYKHILEYTEERRIYDTKKLVSLVLGFICYGTEITNKESFVPYAVPVTPGKTFFAFYYTYKGKDVITRYYSDGTRNGEIYPEPFEVTENLEWLHSKIV